MLWDVATLVVCRVDRIRRLGRQARRAPLSACSNRHTDSPGWHRRRRCSVFSHSSLNTSSTHFLSLHGTTECSWAKNQFLTNFSFGNYVGLHIVNYSKMFSLTFMQPMQLLSMPLYVTINACRECFSKLHSDWQRAEISRRTIIS